MMDDTKKHHLEPQGVEIGSYGTFHEILIDHAAEQKLVRKLDMWLSPMMVLVFLVAYLDRSNVGTFVESVTQVND